MDAVITYVDGMEPIWRYNYEKHSRMAFFVQRYYDFGTLRYVLRGISEHMKFIDRVFLIVSNIEQVPDYVNDNVIIITHDMFIPEQYLPTFNSHTIEMFLWNIPDLSEEFIYFNDDMVPINHLEKEDFFRDNLLCVNFVTDKTTAAQFNTCLETSNYFASSKYPGKEKINYLRSSHIMTPFLKSDFYNNFTFIEDSLSFLASKTRRRFQISQYYFIDCYYYQDKYIDHKIDFIYTHTGNNSEEFIDSIKNIDNIRVICINSYGEFKDKTLLETKKIINEQLNNILPTKGIYER